MGFLDKPKDLPGKALEFLEPLRLLTEMAKDPDIFTGNSLEAVYTTLSMYSDILGHDDWYQIEGLVRYLRKKPLKEGSPATDDEDQSISGGSIPMSEIQSVDGTSVADESGSLEFPASGGGTTERPTFDILPPRNDALGAGSLFPLTPDRPPALSISPSSHNQPRSKSVETAPLPPLDLSAFESNRSESRRSSQSGHSER